MMTRDGLVEKALREQGVFPPSVMDPHYGNKAEMTRTEIVLRSLEEMGLLPLPGQDARLGEKIRRIHAVVAGLQRRLPDGEITMCGAFRLLNVGCCDACHTDPLHEMTLLELPGGGMAWLCCAVEAASSPEPYTIFHERKRDSFGGKVPTGGLGYGGRRED